MLRDALARFHDGLLFFYFSEVDQNSHMLWGRHETDLLATYRAIDKATGMVIASAPDTDIMVMSDHGFAAFDTAVNLNTWLRRKGYLQSEKGAIDWTRTKAYAMGLNALYINLAGREQHGIVRDGAERTALIGELIGRLGAEKPAIERVVALPRTNNRFEPDLIVGYAPGFRASWETALGEIPADVFVPNDDAWIGDHCMAAEAVPGTLIVTRHVTVANPGLKDLTVSILKHFGVAADARMKGRALY
jgi:predicted AlkP superfamily phosphohydrolase/phosphomutase